MDTMNNPDIYRAAKIERPARHTDICFIRGCEITRGGPQIGWIPGAGWACVDCIVAWNRIANAQELTTYPGRP